jgi:dihydroorotase
MDYDLLIKNGPVLDPGANLDGVFDVAVAGDRIAAIEADIAPERARQVLDARGDSRFVVPGLIDVHTHVANGATTPGVGLDCSDPDTVGVYSGVTTVVDTGSVGVTNVGVFDAYIRPRAKTRVLVYVNAGKFALTTAHPADVMSLDEVDPRIDAAPCLMYASRLRRSPSRETPKYSGPLPDTRYHLEREGRWSMGVPLRPLGAMFGGKRT